MGLIKGFTLGSEAYGEYQGACFAQGLSHPDEQMHVHPAVAQIVSERPAMQRVLALAKRVASTPVSVLLTGETGTGKSLLAQYIHLQSPRKERPLIAQNCGAMPESLCESELFGYKRGAFSGAMQDKRGLFEAADGGTIFLDEVSELAPGMQVKLLHVLQDGSLRRLGDSQTRRVDVRIIAATNKDLAAQVKQGNFREDLYYRLNVLSMCIPPLRERLGDIPLLAQHFLDKHRKRINPGVFCFSAEALQRLCDYDYPGNVRELENLVQRALVFASGPYVEIGEWLPSTPDSYPRLSRLNALEREEILKTVKSHLGNLTDAARALGISRSTLWRRLKEYQIEA